MIDATVTPMTRLSGRLSARTPREREAAPEGGTRTEEVGEELAGQLAAAIVREEPVLLAAARALVPHEAEARDLVQATFELALRHGGQLQDRGALRSWLLTIQAREAFRLRRRVRRFVRFDGAVTDLAGRDTETAEAVAVREALRTLPARTRAAVVLHHMAGLSVAEVAAAMGTSPNTVKTQVRIGLARLRRELGDG